MERRQVIGIAVGAATGAIIGGILGIVLLGNQGFGHRTRRCHRSAHRWCVDSASW